jgi:hypothetical protein
LYRIKPDRAITIPCPQRPKQTLFSQLSN